MGTWRIRIARRTDHERGASRFFPGSEEPVLATPAGGFRASPPRRRNNPRCERLAIRGPTRAVFKDDADPLVVALDKIYTVFEAEDGWFVGARRHYEWAKAVMGDPWSALATIIGGGGTLAIIAVVLVFVTKGAISLAVVQAGNREIQRLRGRPGEGT